MGLRTTINVHGRTKLNYPPRDLLNLVSLTKLKSLSPSCESSPGHHILKMGHLSEIDKTVKMSKTMKIAKMTILSVK